MAPTSQNRKKLPQKKPMTIKYTSIHLHPFAQTMQSSKRQRRQAAADLVVKNLWTTREKKTPAANRPPLEVQPLQYGPIRDPNPNDVLAGRGGLINSSSGNVQFRNLVGKRKKQYNAKKTKRQEKAHVAAEIVRYIRNLDPPGRFLKEDCNGTWWDIGDARAIRKTGQALREAGPSMRKEAGEKNDSSDSSNSSEEKRLSRKNDADMSNTKAAPSSTANDNSPNKDTVSEEHNKQHSQNGGDPTPLQAVSTQNVASIQIPLPNEANGRMFETPWTKTAVFGSKRGGKQSRWQRKPPSNKSNEHQIAWKQAPAQEAPLYSHHRPPLPPHHYVALPRMTPGVTFMNYPSYRTFIPLPPGHHYSQHPNMPPPMQQSVNTVPRESSEHAFGRAFYPCPTSDITLGSGGSETVSGLSSSQNDGDEHDYRDASIATDLDGVPPILHSDTNLPDPRDEMDEFDATLQRTNSLPGIRSLEDMEVASSACASDSSNAKSEKRRPIKRIAKGSDEQKENSNSGGSSRSAKSDISVPSSCGNLSVVSDSLSALHLWENQDFELLDPSNGQTQSK